MNRLFALLIACLCTSTPAQESNFKVLPMYGAFGLARSNSESIELQQVVAKIERDLPLIVFVPGILGSKLRWQDGYTFGKSKIDASRIAYRASDRPIASTLNEYEIFPAAPYLPQRFTRKDIYGEAIDKLSILSGGTTVGEFSYDWRSDIDEIAVEFGKWLNDKSRRGRRTIIIAHSMGGLIVTRWLQTTTPKNRPVTVDQVVLAGSPLLGSCEAARMLIQGYGVADGSGLIEDQLVKRLFDDATPALFTFPSLFQLMPRFDRNSSCLKMRVSTRGQLVGMHHHSPEFWLGAPGRNGGLKGGEHSRLTKYAEAVGMTETEYEAAVRAAVEAGARFRQSFDSEPKDDGYSIIYAYSADSDMASGYEISWTQDGWFQILKAASNIKGDGRVLQGSAKNEGHGDARWISRLRISMPHGDLIKDPALLQHLQDNVVRMAEAAINRGIAQLLVSSTFKLQLRASKVVIDPGTYTAETTPESRFARLAVAQFNADQIKPNLGERASTTLAAYASLPELTGTTDVGPYTSALRAALMESSIIVDSSGAIDDRLKSVIALRKRADQRQKASATLQRLLAEIDAVQDKRSFDRNSLKALAQELDTAEKIEDPRLKYVEFFRYRTESMQPK